MAPSQRLDCVVVSEPLRTLLDKHLRDWQVSETSDMMHITGWLKTASVQVQMRGLRSEVVEALQAFIASLVVSERV